MQFDRRLGKGAYKNVYVAYDTREGIEVAWNSMSIKDLPKMEKSRIINEVRLLANLDHKNIINFHGSWFNLETEKVVFITEIVGSGSLKEFIQVKQIIRWRVIKRWCRQILQGLRYLHEKDPPIIHRDLKCENIFINGSTGDIRIGDLGLSTTLHASGADCTQSVLGTPEESSTSH